MNEILIQYYKSPIGELILGEFEGVLCLADWRFRKMRTQIDERIQKGLHANYIKADSELLKTAVSQFEEYFREERTEFSIPLKMVGSEFQQKVWKALQAIPYGETSTYLELSKSLGDEKAIRAVASANGANAISIIVPCHRIIGSNGDLVGYAGGLPAKKKLLQMELKEKFPEQLELFN
jgi:methylated-DNA-[protein]-cysteine S-methyltransferase